MSVFVVMVSVNFYPKVCFQLQPINHLSQEVLTKVQVGARAENNNSLQRSKNKAGIEYFSGAP